MKAYKAFAKKIFPGQRESEPAMSIGHPLNVRQELHVAKDHESGELIGLPPQWEAMIRTFLS